MVCRSNLIDLGSRVWTNFFIELSPARKKEPLRWRTFRWILSGILSGWLTGPKSSMSIWKKLILTSDKPIGQICTKRLHGKLKQGAFWIAYLQKTHVVACITTIINLDSENRAPIRRKFLEHLKVTKVMQVSSKPKRSWKTKYILVKKPTVLDGNVSIPHELVFSHQECTCLDFLVRVLNNCLTYQPPFRTVCAQIALVFADFLWKTLWAIHFWQLNYSSKWLFI